MQSLASWEVATEVILERESLMTKLEDFERAASDPNRFFVKGKNMRLISNRKLAISLKFVEAGGLIMLLE